MTIDPRKAGTSTISRYKLQKNFISQLIMCTWSAVVTEMMWLLLMKIPPVMVSLLWVLWWFSVGINFETVSLRTWSIFASLNPGAAPECSGAETSERWVGLEGISRRSGRKRWSVSHAPRYPMKVDGWKVNHHQTSCVCVIILTNFFSGR